MIARIATNVRLRNILPSSPWTLGTIAVFLALITSACIGGTSEPHKGGKAVRAYTATDVALNAQAALPSFVTADIRDAYQYALGHPEQLQYIPCYCGCGLNVGHKSNAECYVGGVDQDGKVVYDNHASFCSVCIEITRDVERLSAEGKSLREIRTFVEKEHGEKGPGTDTPLPPLGS